MERAAITETVSDRTEADENGNRSSARCVAAIGSEPRRDPRGRSERTQ
ncbi:hypothetical protein [Natronorubrum halophilum]|nr:hypothetical protein [Natronorubrum halophilum]